MPGFSRCWSTSVSAHGAHGTASALVTRRWLLFAAIFGLFAFCLGTILSGMVGIVMGLIFGLFDMVLLDVARSVVGVRGRENAIT